MNFYSLMALYWAGFGATCALYPVKVTALSLPHVGFVMEFFFMTKKGAKEFDANGIGGELFMHMGLDILGISALLYAISKVEKPTKAMHYGAAVTGVAPFIATAVSLSMFKNSPFSPALLLATIPCGIFGLMALQKASKEKSS